MYEGYESVSEVVTTDGKHVGLWLVQDPRYPTQVFDNPEQACALAQAIDRVVPDKEDEE